MPCYHCGVRQTDPVRGPSAWKRGVRGDRQVLICPDCQLGHDWKGDLDRCVACNSTFLVSRLGEIECRGCGTVRPQHHQPPRPDPAPSALADEVARALDRALAGLARF
ncbi:hypothetical protein [Allonocardiopsis opalescens]|uniref:Uncharacterized protein n=1 Tax=Allonocardiopsis opalescens TaxID=1144618 RepID=A0A2T0PUJ6_9ACTN|nr:hypothetical protein [Allonocardiopsis opalescens]PRX92478.1 hypothetical protein CLV72_110240 [Allonocardiopsis opalescens]